MRPLHDPFLADEHAAERLQIEPESWFQEHRVIVSVVGAGAVVFCIVAGWWVR